MERVLLGALLVFVAVIGRFALIGEDSFLGTVITLGAVLAFMGLAGRFAFNYSPDGE